LLYTACVSFATLFITGGALYWWWFLPPYEKVADIPYGQRGDTPLLLDVFRPPRQNGAGVILLVSGGWKSSADSVRPVLFAPFLRRGYTVFAVRHVSQPKCIVGDIVEDMLRSVRFIRHYCALYGVDRNRLGVVGGSSGGHLSLMIATRGGPGADEAPDEIDRESSAVQTVACFYPVTDLLNLGTSTENLGDGGPPKSFKNSFGPRAKSLEEWKVLGREISPIYQIPEAMPPILIVHGDADTLVPLDQSQRFVEQARSQGHHVELEVRPGKGHGWLTIFFDLVLFADWFDKHLAK
jgi:acetyl esterase/lipase